MQERVDTGVDDVAVVETLADLPEGALDAIVSIPVGFELVGRSEILHDPGDDHTTAGFEVGRHTLDRHVLEFRRPST